MPMTCRRWRPPSRISHAVLRISAKLRTPVEAIFRKISNWPFLDWLTRTAIGLAGLWLAWTTVQVSQGSIERRSPGLREQESPYEVSSSTLLDAKILVFGPTEVELGVDEVAWYSFTPNITDVYRIQAISAEENVAPFFYLFEENADDLDAIDIPIFDSYVDHELVAGTRYYVQLLETRGRPGRIDLSLSRVR